MKRWAFLYFITSRKLLVLNSHTYDTGLLTWDAAVVFAVHVWMRTAAAAAVPSRWVRHEQTIQTAKISQSPQ